MHSKFKCKDIQKIYVMFIMQASKFIHIDSRTLQQSIDWILNKQSRKSGCFEASGQLIHSSLAGPEQSLTASVVVSL
jgi:hypothetical protein